MSKFGPLNRFGIWFDKSCTNLEKKSAEFGKDYTLVSLFTRLDILKAPFLLRFLSRRLDRKTLEDSALRLNITDNSSLLFYSKNAGKYLPGIRRWDLIAPPCVFLFCETWLPATCYLFGSFLYQPFAISASRIFVVRMDLLPHMESIMFHKVGMFGTSRVEIVPIKNLVKIKPEFSQHSYYFTYLGGVDMLFKDTETGEEYGFENHGTWIDENLKHSLIN